MKMLNYIYKLNGWKRYSGPMATKDEWMCETCSHYDDKDNLQWQKEPCIKCGTDKGFKYKNNEQVAKRQRTEDAPIGGSSPQSTVTTGKQWPQCRFESCPAHHIPMFLKDQTI